jgi:hypothetical protein
LVAIGGYITRYFSGSSSTMESLWTNHGVSWLVNFSGWTHLIINHL